MSPDHKTAIDRGRGGVWVLLAIFLFGVAQQWPTHDRGLNHHDEGHILLFAKIMSDGGELYRDAFVYPLPGAFHLLSWLFRVFGPSNLLARQVVVVEFAVLLVLAFVLMRRIAGPAWAWASVGVLSVYRVWAFPQWHIYNYSTTALTLQLLALVLLAGWIERRDRRWLAGAGLVFGLGVACKQDYGAAALVTFLAMILAARRSLDAADRPGLAITLATFLLPASAIGVWVGLWYWHVGVLPDLLRFTVFQHFAGMTEYAYTEFPPLLPLFEQDPLLRGPIGTEAYLPGILGAVDYGWYGSDLFQKTAWVDTALKLYYYAPFPILLAGAFRLWRRRGRRLSADGRTAWLCELALLLFAGTLFADVSLNRPQDFLHLAVVYWPLLLIGLLLARGVLAGRPRLALGAGLVSAVPALVVVAFTARLAWGFHALHPTPLATPRAGISVTPEQARLLDDVVDYVHARTAPDETVAALPYFPLILFYADRVGPHRSAYVMWPVPETPNRDEEVIAAFEEKRTDLVLYSLNRFWSLDTLDVYAPALFDYLVQNFEIERVFAYDHDYAFAAAVRHTEPRSGRLLPRLAGDATLRITSDDAPPIPVSPRSRPDVFALSAWPFRPVLALRPTLGRRTVLSIPLAVGPDQHLLTAVGVHPNFWYQIPDPRMTFRIDVVDGGARTPVFEHAVNPMEHFEDLGWTDVDVSLAPWSGRRVVLELSTETDEPTGEQLLMGGWEIPRVVDGDDDEARS